MHDIFNGMKIGNTNPLNEFMNSLKKGHYSDYYEKELELEKKITDYDMKKATAEKLRSA